MNMDDKTDEKTREFLEWVCGHASNMAGEAADVEAYGRDCEGANGELQAADEYLENTTIGAVLQSYLDEIRDALGTAENARDAAETLMDALKAFEVNVEEAIAHFKSDNKAEFDDDAYEEKFF